MSENTINDYQQALAAILREEDIGGMLGDLPEDPTEAEKFKNLLTDHIGQALTQATIGLVKSAGEEVQRGMAADFQQVMDYSQRLAKIQEMHRLAANAGAQALANGLPPEKAREAVRKAISTAKAQLAKEKDQAAQDQLLQQFRAEAEAITAQGYPNKIEKLFELKIKYRQLGLKI